MVAVVALLKLVALLPCTAAWWWQQELQSSTTRPGKYTLVLNLGLVSRLRGH